MIAEFLTESVRVSYMPVIVFVLVFSQTLISEIRISFVNWLDYNIVRSEKAVPAAEPTGL
jgi:hypothetical protein